MNISFKKKVLLPDGEHDVTIMDINEVETSLGTRVAIKLEPDSVSTKYQDLVIWISENEDADGICGKILACVAGDDEGDYTIEDLQEMLCGLELRVKTKQNTKDGKTYVNITEVIEVYDTDDESDSSELEEDEEDEDDDADDMPVLSTKRTRRINSATARRN